MTDDEKLDAVRAAHAEASTTPGLGQYETLDKYAFAVIRIAMGDAPSQAARAGLLICFVKVALRMLVVESSTRFAAFIAYWTFVEHWPRWKQYALTLGLGGMIGGGVYLVASTIAFAVGHLS
jgi:hypothetical protein